MGRTEAGIVRIINLDMIITTTVMYYTLPELHADLFSRHASPLEVYVLAAVDERGEDVMSDEMCRVRNRKQQRARRGGRSVQLPDWVINKTKRQHIIALTWVTKMKSLS